MKMVSCILCGFQAVSWQLDNRSLGNLLCGKVKAVMISGITLIFFKMWYMLFFFAKYVVTYGISKIAL